MAWQPMASRVPHWANSANFLFCLITPSRNNDHHFGAVFRIVPAHITPDGGEARPLQGVFHIWWGAAQAE